MIVIRRTRWLIPLLALGVSVALAASVHAQYRDQPASSGSSVTFQVRFGAAPHWTSVDGTQVEQIREDERPNYDLFRYGGNYYAYNNNRWYRSASDRGDYTAIDENAIPRELTQVRREHWRNYPQAWVTPEAGPGYRRTDMDPGRQAYQGSSRTMQVRFGSTPRWSGIGDSRVEEISGADRPDYDVFRFNGSYYAYDNDQWYSSDADQGDYTMIDEQSVPRELAQVPRSHWHNYPSTWAIAYNQPPVRRAPMSLTVSYGNNPRWGGIHSTGVREIRSGDRPGYDLFRYGGTYYAYSDGQWYSSRRQRGMFMAIDERFVPRELARIPRDHWRNYPATWDGRRGPGYDDRDYRNNRDYRR